ncbi:MAG: hypothetical protein JXQ73_18085 [Phycisphaerae bacterium]|nr:hypothetical protein [Phycisphaerae bacterium]
MGRSRLSRVRDVLLAWCLCSVSFAAAEITEDRVLLLVNDASSSGHYAATLYRQYHPGVPEDHVVYLTGLGAVTSSADEIITRGDFETYIAQPIRQYLLDHDLVDQVRVIVTTPGMPYRIADTTYPLVVYPHGSDATTVINHLNAVDAASVESELAVLWQIDPALDPNCRAPLAARIVNPYHGYVSQVSDFDGDRDVLARRETFHFAVAPTDYTRVYEGQVFSAYRASGGRQFSAADIYLVARLDGPRTATVPPDVFVGRMLDMAARVSNPGYSRFHGYDPFRTGVIIDDKATGTVSDSNKWHNAGSSIGQDTLPQDYLTFAAYPTPPNVLSNGFYHDDFRYAFRSLVGLQDLPDPNGGLVVGLMALGRIGGPVVYDPENNLIGSSLDPDYGIGALCSFGVHQGDPSVTPTYLLDGGPGGTPLIKPVYGAIFNSTESFNAVTFFSDAVIPTWAQQALIWQWFYIGGSGALGHVFEPMADSVADNDLLLFNYFRDADADRIGDMTFVEAAYSAIPYLSWATVVVGDPLMRIHRVDGAGPGWWEPSHCGVGYPEGVASATALLLVLGFARRRSL